MKRRLWPFLTCVGILILGGGFLLLHRIVIVQLENLDHPRTVRIPLDRSGRFSLSYVHSMYDAPVIEEFEILGDKIFLKGVRTKSPAVMEYYGLDARGEFHPVQRELGRIRLRVRMGEAQRVSCEGREISLSAVGNRGDLIEVRPASMSLGQYLITGLWGLRGSHECQRTH